MARLVIAGAMACLASGYLFPAFKVEAIVFGLFYAAIGLAIIPRDSESY